MQIGLVKKQGLILCTQLDNIEDLNKIRYVLKNKYNLDSRIINQEEKPRIFIGGGGRIFYSFKIYYYFSHVSFYVIQVA